MSEKEKDDAVFNGGTKSPETQRRSVWFFAGLAALAVFLIYLPSLNNHFVNWDDPIYIQNNPNIRSLGYSSIYWMFTNFYAAFWMPLTWFSLALDFKLGGLNPTVFHAHNLALHILNTLLVFFLGLKVLTLAWKNNDRIGSKQSAQWVASAAFLCALMFGLHPIHTETVAWASGRKDLLCGFFFLSSLLFYLDYAGGTGRRSFKYGTCLVLSLLALFSKPMAITLPLVFILLDGWPLRRLGKTNQGVFLEKIPFLVAVLAVAGAAVAAQAQNETLRNLQNVPLDIRLLNAFHSIFFYLWKMIWPMNLAAFYPLEQREYFYSSGGFMPVFFAVLVSGTCWYFRKKKPYLALAGLYYLVTLAPVLGLVQVGGHCAADRYTYLPSLGPLMLAASGVAFLFFSRQRIFFLLTLCLTIALGYGTLRQAGTWKDSVTLWENVARVSPGGSIVIQVKLGNAYQEAGRLDDAIREYDRAIEMAPDQAVPRNWKGSALYSKGLVAEAVREFKAAIACDPNDPLPRGNLCVAYQRQGLFRAALTEAEEAVRLAPDLANAQNNLGLCYLVLKMNNRAVAAFEKAVALAPGHPQYLANLADTFSQSGRMNDAIPLYQKAIDANPVEVNYYLSLGHAYYQSGQLDRAVETLQEAAKVQPQNPSIYQRLGLAYEKAGRKDLAAENFAKAKALQGAYGSISNAKTLRSSNKTNSESNRR